MRGLADKHKRREFFHFIKDKRPDVVFVQETHSIKKVQQIWRNQWKGKIIFSHGTSNSRGVCIMINKDSDIKINTCKELIEGRVLNAVITYNNQQILLSNVYAPNEDDPQFFETLFEDVQTYSVDHTVVGGILIKF